MAIFLIKFIYKSRQRIIANLIGTHKSRKEERDRKFALNSIVLNLTCFVLMLPLQFDLCFSAYLKWSADLNQMMFTIGVTVFTIQNASSFFINISVNSVFYAEFLIMFGLRRRRQRRPQKQGLTNNKLVVETNANSANTIKMRGHKKLRKELLNTFEMEVLVKDKPLE